MKPDLQITAYNFIWRTLSNLKDISECNAPSDMIDWYEEGNPSDKEQIRLMRNELCDITFELYKEKYPSTK